MPDPGLFLNRRVGDFDQAEIVEPGGSGAGAAVMSQAWSQFDLGAVARVEEQSRVGPILGADDGTAGLNSPSSQLSDQAQPRGRCPL